jgi:hypothetical protein
MNNYLLFLILCVRRICQRIPNSTVAITPCMKSYLQPNRKPTNFDAINQKLQLWGRTSWNDVNAGFVHAAFLCSFIREDVFFNKLNESIVVIHCCEFGLMTRLL